MKNRKNKLLFLIPSLDGGGAEKVLVNLVNNLNPEKFDITVQTIYNIGINQQYLNKNIRYKYCIKKYIPGFSKIFKLFSSEFLHKLFIKDFYDIEISYLEGITARIISGCKNKNTKLIAWIHCTMNNKNYYSTFRNIQEADNCYNKFNKIIFVSEDAKSAFENYFHNDEKFQVLYNINETEKIKKMFSCSSEIKFNNNTFNIISVGKIEKIKGFERLAKVQKQLIENNYSTHIYILGNGSEKNIIEKYLIDNNLTESWTFLGYQSNPYCYMSQADLYVCSSYSEALSTSVIEAMLLNIPVLTTNCSGMKEILGENEAGLITDNNETALFEGIKYLIDNPEKLKYYKNQAKIRSKMFSKDILIKQYEDLFFALCEK